MLKDITLGQYFPGNSPVHRMDRGIAGVLAMQPRCVVLDEATAMLDPVGRQEVLDTILRLNREGVTVALITHHMDEAALASRVLVLDHGRIAADGPPKEVFRDVYALRKLGLEPPETVALLNELRRAGLDVPLDALSAEECAQAIYSLLVSNS